MDKLQLAEKFLTDTEHFTQDEKKLILGEIFLTCWLQGTIAQTKQMQIVLNSINDEAKVPEFNVILKYP